MKRNQKMMNYMGTVKAYVGAPLTLEVKDGVGELMLYDYVDAFWGISADSVVKTLAGQNLTKLVVRINSPGGDVFEGFTIYNFLKSRSYPVETINDGSAASIASIILMAGSKVMSSPRALIMIHDPWMMTMGNAQQLRTDADLLDKTAEELRQVYVTKSGMAYTDIKAMMEAETWLSAEEALAMKLIDEIVQHDTTAGTDNTADAARALYNSMKPLPKDDMIPDDAGRKARSKALMDIAKLRTVTD